MPPPRLTTRASASAYAAATTATAASSALPAANVYAAHTLSLLLSVLLLHYVLPSPVHSLVLIPSPSPSPSPRPPAPGATAARIISPVVYGSTTCASSATTPIVVTAESRCPCFLRYVISSDLPTVWDVFFVSSAAYDRWADAGFVGDPDPVVDSLSTRSAQTVDAKSILATPDTDVFLSGRFRLVIRTNTNETRCFLDGRPGRPATSVVLQPMPTPCPTPPSTIVAARRTSSHSASLAMRMAYAVVAPLFNVVRDRYRQYHFRRRGGSPLLRIAGGSVITRHVDAPWTVQIIKVSRSSDRTEQVGAQQEIATTSQRHHRRPRHLTGARRQEIVQQQQGKTPWSCTGVFVSPGYVLTAAHCGIQDKTAHFRVRISLADDDVRLFRISRTFVHDRYAVTALSSSTPLRASYVYDVVLLELPGITAGRFNAWGLSSVTLPRPVNNASTTTTSSSSSAMQPALPPEGAVVTASGYGAVASGWTGGNQSVLRRVALQVTSDARCQAVSADINMSIHVCASGGVLADTSASVPFSSNDDDNNVIVDSNLDGCGSCDNDDGGPLVVVNDATAAQPPTLVGVTSFAIACGNPGPPTVYTRVAAVAAWVDGATLYAVTTRKTPFWDRAWAVALTFIAIIGAVVALVVGLVVMRRKGLLRFRKGRSDVSVRHHSGSDMPSETGISE